MIRDARASDAGALLSIYAPLVRDTAVSFEISVPTVDAFAERIASAGLTHAWLVAEDADGPLGYAYGTAHRTRAAYRYSTETSVYVAEHARRRGVGSELYARLFERLAERGFHRAYAGITLPNERSVAFHRACGFEPVGTFVEVGHKFGGWHDVSWWQRALRSGMPVD